jgi:hypothetical protein
MAFFKRLFSAPETVADTVKSAVRGLDDLVYTEQEAAEKTQMAQDIYAKLWQAAVPSAVSRRVIASVIVLVWAFLIVFATAAYALSADDVATFTLDLLKTIVLQPMNIVVGFYFLKQVVTEYRKS